VFQVNPLLALLTVVVTIASPDIRMNGDDGGFTSTDAVMNAAETRTTPLANPPCAGMRVTKNAVPADAVPDRVEIIEFF
jgi:hypothetical protein